ncbi:MAG: glycosyltransferase [Acetobacteraceae bacterium]|jgi:glycosyltransferase involved in cell wall biosynthesis|nr:glycosyltransferase [Roseomonas sp.]
MVNKLTSLIQSSLGRSDHVRRGNELRDSGQFAKAAEAYGEHLASHPKDFGIWVQRGNCLKDSGAFDGAEAAYSKAISLRDDDADVFLQFGHLMKLRQKRKAALQAYQKSLSLKPDVSVAAEVIALGGSEEMVSKYFEMAGGSFFFEIYDLLVYHKAHIRPSGIQRVQARIISALLANEALGQNTVFVIMKVDGDHSPIKMIDRRLLQEFLDVISGSTQDHDQVKNLISQMETSAIEVFPKNRDVFLILGAFWATGGFAAKYGEMKRQGVLVGAYIYDIIPIQHPEFCADELVPAFFMALGDGLSVLDFIFTISEFTAREVQGLLSRNGLPEIPVIAIPLAHSFDQENDLDGGVVDRNVENITHRPYVLFVSTIEARKNHALLVAIWRRMLKDGLEPPDLVFVGRKGWRVNDLFEALHGSKFLGGKVHILHDVSDVDLRRLYEKCRFTVFPSFVEGWGLPVGESLVYGRPCVASNTSSIPEVGGDFVDYIDPANSSQAESIIRKLCFDHSYLDQRAKNIKDNFKPRDWSDVGKLFISRLQEMRTSRPPSGALIRLPMLQQGEFFWPSDLFFNDVTEQYLANPLRVALNTSWYRPEDFGVWMRGEFGYIEFKTDLAQGSEVTIFASFSTPPWADQTEVRCWTGGDLGAKSSSLNWTKLRTKKTIVISGEISEGGILRLNIVTRNGGVPPDTELRNFCIGLRAIAFARSTDLLKRIQMLEELVLG